MITVIPGFTVMKSVTDNNIDSAASQKREEAFSLAAELQTRADVDVLIEGSIFERIKIRLTEEHETHFNTSYRKDYSVAETMGFNHTSAIDWVAQSESNSRYVIIVDDNPDQFSVNGDRIRVKTPSQFCEEVEEAKIAVFRKFKDLDDSLMAKLF